MVGAPCRICPCGSPIPLPLVAARYARETARATDLLRRFGYALGGLPSARLLCHLGVGASADTVLRRLKGAPQPKDGHDVRVLGVDDWAWHKHQRYGTILMDLEKNCVIDLLPVRSVASLAEWLRSHSGVRLIARDRSLPYADGAKRGAPQARQVHDRFHLVSNLTEAIEADVQSLQGQALAKISHGPPQPTRSGRPSWREARRLRCREARLQRYRAVVALARQGATQLAIAAQVRVRPGTIAGWLQAGEFPERSVRSNRRCGDAALLREVASGRVLVQRSFSAGRIAALLIKAPRLLSDTQRAYLDGFLRLCPTVAGLRRLALQFRAMIRWHKGSTLRSWIRNAAASGFPFVARYAKSLRRDLAAVRLSITVPWSNGPIEGQINRLKAIKRQMYGCAGFALLKARVVPFAESPTLAAASTESA